MKRVCYLLEFKDQDFDPILVKKRFATLNNVPGFQTLFMGYLTDENLEDLRDNFLIEFCIKKPPT